MKSRFLTLILACVFLAGCKAEEKEITFEEVKTISQDILNRIKSEDYKRPSKLTYETIHEFEETVNETSESKSVQKATSTYKRIIDETAKYRYEWIETVSDDGKEVVEKWIYSKNDVWILAQKTTFDGETAKHYEEFQTEPDFSYYLDFCARMTSSVLNPFVSDRFSEEDMKEACSSYKFTSSGKYNVTIEENVKDSGYFKYVLEDCLIVYSEGNKEKTKYDWGKAKISKPNLSEFDKIDRTSLFN